MGLDVHQLKRDMETPRIRNVVSNNHRLAKALRIDGTPALIVGDEIARGAIPLEAARGDDRQGQGQGLLTGRCFITSRRACASGSCPMLPS